MSRFRSPSWRVSSLACLLLAAGLLGAPPVASVERSSDGYGEVLLFPFATGGPRYTTLLTVAPTVNQYDFFDRTGVAARVVVHLEDESQHPVAMRSHAFTVVFAGNDSWTATVYGTPPQLSTSDDSCAWDQAGEPMGTASRVLSPHPTQGWIEVYELGAIEDRILEEHLDLRRCSEFLASIEGLPVDDWLAPPDNRLRGNVQLLDIYFGLNFTLAPTALRDFRDAAWWQGLVAEGPTLADAVPPQAVVTLPDGSRRSSTFSAHPVDAVSAVLTDAQWELDFNTESTIAAQTDLLVLAPTQSWYEGDSARAPFAAGGEAPTWGRAHDREGRHETFATTKCSPQPPVIGSEGPIIDRPMHIVQLGERTLLAPFFGFEVLHVLPDGGSCYFQGGPIWQHIPAGRFVLEFATNPVEGIGGMVSDEGHAFIGLPVIGVGVTKASLHAGNGNAANVGLLQPIARRTRYQP